MKQEELERRTPLSEKTVEIAWKCPACGKPQMKEADVCPDCGVIVAKFRQAPAKAEDDVEQSKIVDEETTVEYVWKCSACGKPQQKSFNQCPECGVVGSKITSPPASELAKGIKDSETQGDRRPSGIKAPQNFLRGILGTFSKRRVYVIGSIGGLILLFIVIVSFRALLDPAHVLPTNVKQNLLAPYKDNHQSILVTAMKDSYPSINADPEFVKKWVDEHFNLKVIKAEKAAATQEIRDKKNPKGIYCVRFSVSGDLDMKQPSAFNVIVYQLQSGELEATSIGAQDYIRGYNDCPEGWDNICPFGCEDSNLAVKNLRKRLEEIGTSSVVRELE